MELKDLKPAEGSRHSRKRVGRGPASGTGKTAGRGLNGQKSRSSKVARLLWLVVFLSSLASATSTMLSTFPLTLAVSRSTTKLAK